MDLQDIYVLLDDLAKYMDKRSDVVDGSYGEPAPNQEMMFVNRIAGAMETLEEIIDNG